MDSEAGPRDLAGSDALTGAASEKKSVSGSGMHVFNDQRSEIASLGYPEALGIMLDRTGII